MKPAEDIGCFIGGWVFFLLIIWALIGHHHEQVQQVTCTPGLGYCTSTTYPVIPQP